MQIFPSWSGFNSLCPGECSRCQLPTWGNSVQVGTRATHACVLAAYRNIRSCLNIGRSGGGPGYIRDPDLAGFIPLSADSPVAGSLMTAKSRVNFFCV